MEGLQALSQGVIATIWGSILGLLFIVIFGFMEIISPPDNNHDGDDE